MSIRHTPLLTRTALFLAALLALLAAVALAPRLAAADEPASASAQSTPPDAPGSITFTRTGTGFRGKGTLTASWPAVSDATKYEIAYTADKGRVWKTLASEHTYNSITFEIWNGNTYYVKVRAGNANGWSGWTQSLESPPIPNPLPPNMLPAPDWVSVTRGNGTLTATWAAVSGAIKYRIESSTDFGVTFQLLSDNHTTTSYIISNANNGSTYTIAVRAGKSNNYFSFGPISYSAPSGPYTPSPSPSPTLTAGSLSKTGATLTIANYTGQWWYKANTGPDDSCSNTAVAGSSVNLSGLSPGTSYTYTAYSNWVCTTSIATADAFTTTGTTGEVLNADLTVTNRTATTATLNLANNSYWWTYEETASGDCSYFLSNFTTTADLTGLTPNTSYTYKAYPRSNCVGDPMDSVTFTTLTAPTTLTTSAIGRTTATLTIANHTAQWWYKADVGPDSTCQGPVAAGTSAESLTGLTEETTYVYKAYSATGCGATNLLATAASFTTLPPPHVTNLHTVSSVGSGISSTVKQGAAFTTGPNPTGYTLSSITASLAKNGNVTPSNLAITLHSMEGTNPYDNQSSYPSSTTLATLTGTAPTSTSFADTVFTCSGSGCELEAGTTYFVVATYTGTNGNYAWRYAGSNNVTRYPSGNGWNIGRSHEKSTGNDWRSWGDWHIFRADFEYNPSLTASNVTSSSATLTLNHHTGTWYSKRIHPDTTVCSVAVTGATQNRDNLNSNATYVYTAYSDSNCTAANALATAYFSTTDAAVGNLAEAQESTNWAVGGSTGVKYATAFTTGSHSAGYALAAVTLDFAAKTGTAGDISVALHAADTGNASNPAATASATLSGSDPDAAGLQTYACSGSGCDLSASTTYFIVTSAATGTGSYNQRNTASDSETLQSAAGWSIANAGRSKTGAAAWGAATGSASMRVAANENPPTLNATTIASTTATLTIANHTGNWHHKETHPSTTASCSASANTGTTASLSALTADRFYAFTAYSDSGCTSANALATAYFSTTDDGVGNLNQESDFHISVGLGGSNNQSVAATFTTGSASSVLKSVTLRFNDKSATGTTGSIQVKLHEPDSTNSSNPSSTTKATLSGSNPTRRASTPTPAPRPAS